MKIYKSSDNLNIADEMKNGRRAGRILSLSQEERAGYIALEYAYLYPPGTPLIVPGELITEEAAGLLGRYNKAGYSVEGVSDRGRILALDTMDK